MTISIKEMRNTIRALAYALEQHKDLVLPPDVADIVQRLFDFAGKNLKHRQNRLMVGAAIHAMRIETGKSFADIGEILGVSRQRVHQLHREYMNVNGIKRVTKVEYISTTPRPLAPGNPLPPESKSP